jgi:hypothetical protein
MPNTGCTVVFKPPSGSMSPACIVRQLVIHKGRLAVLTAALIAAMGLTACGPSSSNDPSLPSGTESTGLYTPSADPYAPSDQTTTDPYAPSDETNHCAYAGDPLCPDTSITVPPPNLSSPY